MNKKIVLIAPGYMPLPAPAWGACERIVWDYYENLLKRNYNVIIVNTTNTNSIIKECNDNIPDIIHMMYDDYIDVVPFLNCKKIYYTSHFAYLTHPEFNTKYNCYFNNIFMKVIENKNSIYINVISEQIKNLYVKWGFPEEKINIIHNGSREDLFKYTNKPEKNFKSIYLGKVDIRKRQYKYQSISNIDFVGNYHDSSFNRNNDNYLGEWTKDQIYNNMTEYGNLILLSDGEADPLVVKEALISGLGVVVSECSSANLDLSKTFITIVPNHKLDDLEYVTKAIIENREKSINMRSEIREYALNTFGWNNIIDKYCKLCLE
jgi:glycosyltransferase involved in cell wall biosynthesis